MRNLSFRHLFSILFCLQWVLLTSFCPVGARCFKGINGHISIDDRTTEYTKDVEFSVYSYPLRIERDEQEKESHEEPTHSTYYYGWHKETSFLMSESQSNSIYALIIDSKTITLKIYESTNDDTPKEIIEWERK